MTITQGRRATAPTVDGDRGVDWRDLAACRGEDPELFFPTGTAGPALQQTVRALAVCRRCTVIDDCNRWADGTGERYGVWGGRRRD